MALHRPKVEGSPYNSHAGSSSSSSILFHVCLPLFECTCASFLVYKNKVCDYYDHVLLFLHM